MSVRPGSSWHRWLQIHGIQYAALDRICKVAAGSSCSDRRCSSHCQSKDRRLCNECLTNYMSLLRRLHASRFGKGTQPPIARGCLRASRCRRVALPSPMGISSADVWIYHRFASPPYNCLQYYTHLSHISYIPVLTIHTNVPITFPSL